MSDDPDHVNRGSVYKKLVLFNRVFSVTPAVTIIGKKLMRIPFVFDIKPYSVCVKRIRSWTTTDARWVQEVRT